jgi:tRNA nucleotidyltransferase (CCA-adding enzyme)
LFKMSVESEVLRTIKPTPDQDRKVASVVQELSRKVDSTSLKLGAHVETMLVGSVAKGTHLKDPDIDLFMLFPESTELKELKEKGLAIGRRILDGKEHYAQHPYVRGMYKGFQVDLVPCFRIRDTRKKMSAVDRTPFHTDFVRGNLNKGDADQVRLLKQFMKGIECYGAEARVQGFSGYLCELLVMRFGGFKQVLEAASSWAVGESIHLPGYEGKEFTDPLAFIDPVDSSRNVASAVSAETFLRFIRASRGYLRAPGRKFFFPAPRADWDMGTIRKVAGKRLANLVSITFPNLDLIDDVVYPQLRKSLANISALLERAEFEIEKTSIHVDELSHLTVELESMTLPAKRKHRGPPVNSENVSEFLAKWNSLGVSKPYVEEGRWYVTVRRDYVRADDLLKAKLSHVPLGKDIKAQGKFNIYSGEQLLAKEHLGAMTRHFDERMPWER